MPSSPLSVGLPVLVCDCNKLTIVNCVAFEMLYMLLLLMHQLGAHGMMWQQKGNKSFEDRTLFTFGIRCKLLLYLVVYLSLHTDCVKNSLDTCSHCDLLDCWIILMVTVKCL